jgi:imidazolonepropionase-like amidohydrolase
MDRITLSNAEIFDGEKALPGRSAVHIAGDKIVGLGAAPSGFEADETIDCTGMTVMPGMVSCHFHASMNYLQIASYFDQPVGTERPPGVLMLAAANAMKAALMTGYTAVIGAGSSDYIDPQLKMAMAEGIIIGPRILPCSHGFDTPGHSLNDPANFYWWKDMRKTGSFMFCSGPDEFQKAIRNEVRCGAEMIKIFATTGHGAEEPRNIKGFTTRELAAIVEASHERNVKVRAHCVYRDDIIKCIEHGVDVIDHGDEIDDACIELMLKKGTYLIPSMYLLHRLRDHAEYNVHEAHDLNERPEDATYRDQIRRMKQASDAGVKMLIGDDYGLEGMGHEEGGYLHELGYYVNEMGIAPADVLRWATKNGAELLGPHTGTVAAGKLADLIVVDGRPHEDISALATTETIRLIMLGGKAVKNTLADRGVQLGKMAAQ